MFRTMNASQEPGVKTSFQGWRMSLAEESLGCHFCRALDSLLRMGEVRLHRGELWVDPRVDGDSVCQRVPVFHLLLQLEEDELVQYVVQDPHGDNVYPAIQEVHHGSQFLGCHWVTIFRTKDIQTSHLSL